MRESRCNYCGERVLIVRTDRELVITLNPQVDMINGNITVDPASGKARIVSPGTGKYVTHVSKCPHVVLRARRRQAQNKNK
jgi:hypothetical protein